MNYVELGYHVPSATHIVGGSLPMEKLLSKITFKQRPSSLLLQQILGPVRLMTLIYHLPVTSLPVDGIWLPAFWQKLHFLSTTGQTTLLRRYSR